MGKNEKEEGQTYGVIKLRGFSARRRSKGLGSWKMTVMSLGLVVEKGWTEVEHRRCQRLPFGRVRDETRYVGGHLFAPEITFLVEKIATNLPIN